MAAITKFLTDKLYSGLYVILDYAASFYQRQLLKSFLKRRSGVIILGLGCILVYYHLPEARLPASDKAVLITGCDSGFGHALATHLDQLGMKVFAGCLYAQGPGALDLQNKCSPKLRIIQLDVTQNEEIDSAAKEIKEDLEKEGVQGLWGVVNIAGIWYTADIEMTPEFIWKKLMDVNLMGTIRVNKSFLPLVRQAKGRFITMSSLTGRVGFKYYGAYSASKHAIEAYSDVLRLEMEKWGVNVSIIEPAGFKTGALTEEVIKERKEEVWSHLDVDTKETYGREYLDSMYANVEVSASKFSTDLNPVVRAIERGLLTTSPLDRYAVGKGSGLFLAIFYFLPTILRDKLCHLLDPIRPNVPALLLISPNKNNN